MRVIINHYVSLCDNLCHNALFHRYSVKCLWIKGQYFLVLKCPKKNQWQASASLKLKDEFPASSRGWQVTRCWRTEETTEMKQQSESSWPGVYRGALASAFFSLCWLQTFLGREREDFKAQTLRKLAPCWEHASLPSPTADAATVRCPLFPFPSPHAGNTRNEKSSPSYQSRTQYTSKTRRENTIPPSFGWTNREISAQFVQSLL